MNYSHSTVDHAHATRFSRSIGASLEISIAVGVAVGICISVVSLAVNLGAIRAGQGVDQRAFQSQTVGAVAVPVAHNSQRTS
jgi:hypothetical protein